MKLIIYNPKTNLFDFFLKSIECEFKERNIDTIYLNGVNNETIDLKKDILLIIINPHFIFDYEDIYNKITHYSKIFKYKVLYITEPINFIIEQKIYIDIIKIINPFCLWTYTTENLKKLNIRQKIFKVFPNYNNTYCFTDNILPNELKERLYDRIVFIGNITDNRINICNSFNDIQLLINFRDKWRKDEWKEILETHLFYLNIHRRINCKSFESFRIIPILSNGGVIFSERVNEYEENIFKRYNIIFTERENLLETFIDYKNNINYDEIYRKTILFREEMSKYSGINCFLDFFTKIIS